MHIQLLTASNESLIEGVVFNTSGVIGHIIHETNYKEVMLLTDVSHSLPVKNISEDFLDFFLPVGQIQILDTTPLL